MGEPARRGMQPENEQGREFVVQLPTDNGGLSDVVMREKILTESLGVWESECENYVLTTTSREGGYFTAFAVERAVPKARREGFLAVNETGERRKPTGNYIDHFFPILKQAYPHLAEHFDRPVH